MSYFLKRFELQTISRITTEALAKVEKEPPADGSTDAVPAPIIIPIEAEVLMRMIREIEQRRQKNYENWCKRMAIAKRKAQK